MIAVSVNGHAANAAAIVERGHLLLPLRATASALGATVEYDAARRVVIVRAPRRRIELDPTIRDGRSYVPLRFVAEALGANVRYDARNRSVAISTRRTIPVAARRPEAVRVTQTIPGDGTRIQTAYPTISATLGSYSADPGSVHLSIDGDDVTPLATFDGATVTYLPRHGLAQGSHTAEFSGLTASGTPFDATWSFQTTLQAPADLPAQNIELDQYAYQFFQNGAGWFRPGDWMHFTLIAPPGGSAYMQLCGLGYEYPLSNQGYGTQYTANLPAPYGYWIGSCRVTATYMSWTGQTYIVPQPIYISLYTLPGTPASHPTPPPAPTPHAIAVPTHEPRKPEPTPQPHPVRTALPQPAQAPVRPVHVPKPRATLAPQ